MDSRGCLQFQEWSLRARYWCCATEIPCRIHRWYRIDRFGCCLHHRRCDRGEEESGLRSNQLRHTKEQTNKNYGNEI